MCGHCCNMSCSVKTAPCGHCLFPLFHHLGLIISTILFLACLFYLFFISLSLSLLYIPPPMTPSACSIITSFPFSSLSHTSSHSFSCSFSLSPSLPSTRGIPYGLGDSGRGLFISEWLTHSATVPHAPPVAGKWSIWQMNGSGRRNWTQRKT